MSNNSNQKLAKGFVRSNLEQWCLPAPSIDLFIQCAPELLDGTVSTFRQSSTRGCAWRQSLISDAVNSTCNTEGISTEFKQTANMIGTKAYRILLECFAIIYMV